MDAAFLSDQGHRVASEVQLHLESFFNDPKVRVLFAAEAGENGMVRKAQDGPLGASGIRFHSDRQMLIPFPR
jgi:hypothetical protein